MRSSVAFALIGLNVVCWTTIASADDTTQAATEKRKILATAPRHVDTTHGVSTAPNRAGGTLIANVAGASASASAIQPSMVGATASFMSASTVTADGVNPASFATFTTSSYTGSAATGVSTGGVKIEPTFRETAGVGASRTSIDRTGTVATLGSVRTATTRPMGPVAPASDFATLGVRPGAAAQPNGIVAVGGVLSAAVIAGGKAGLLHGIEAANVRATALAAVPSGVVPEAKPDAMTSRAVGVWNSATSMGDPMQRVKPIRNKH